MSPGLGTRSHFSALSLLYCLCLSHPPSLSFNLPPSLSTSPPVLPLSPKLPSLFFLISIILFLRHRYTFFYPFVFFNHLSTPLSSHPFHHLIPLSFHSFSFPVPSLYTLMLLVPFPAVFPLTPSPVTYFYSVFHPLLLLIFSSISLPCLPIPIPFLFLHPSFPHFPLLFLPLAFSPFFKIIYFSSLFPFLLSTSSSGLPSSFLLLFPSLPFSTSFPLFSLHHTVLPHLSSYMLPFFSSHSSSFSFVSFFSLPILPISLT